MKGARGANHTPWATCTAVASCCRCRSPNPLVVFLEAASLMSVCMSCPQTLLPQLGRTGRAGVRGFAVHGLGNAVAHGPMMHRGRGDACATPMAVIRYGWRKEGFGTAVAHVCGRRATGFDAAAFGPMEGWATRTVWCDAGFRQSGDRRRGTLWWRALSPKPMPTRLAESDPGADSDKASADGLKTDQTLTSVNMWRMAFPCAKRCAVCAAQPHPLCATAASRTDHPLSQQRSF